MIANLLIVSYFFIKKDTPLFIKIESNNYTNILTFFDFLLQKEHSSKTKST